MSNIEEILINFNQEALLDLFKQVYYCLEALNNKNN